MKHMDKAIVYIGGMALAVVFKNAWLAGLVIVLAAAENWN